MRMVLVFLVVCWLVAPARATQMICKVTQNAETLEIISIDCTPALADSISVRYEYVRVYVGGGNPWMSGGVSFGDAIAATFAKGGGDRARTRIVTRLRSVAFHNKIRQALKKLVTVEFSLTKIAAACEIAARSVVNAQILNDRPATPDDEVMGYVDLTRLVREVFGQPMIYVDGTIAASIEKEWASTGLPEPGGTLANTLLHEAMHVVFDELELPNTGKDAVHTTHHKYMEEIGVPPCGNRINTKCSVLDDGTHPTMKTIDLPSRSLELVARNRIRARIPDGTLVAEPSGAIAVVHGKRAFRLASPPTAEQVATTGYTSKKALPIWSGALDELYAPRDNLTVQEPGRWPMAFIGGAPIPVPPAVAAKRKVWPLWNGALAGYPTAPRDGTVVWEYEDPAPNPTYVFYGGARFEVAPARFKELGLDRFKTIQVWTGATAGFSTIPRDGTLLRTSPKAVDLIKGGKRYRIPDAQAAAKLKLELPRAYVVPAEALSQIPEGAWGCDLAIEIERIDRTRIVAGDGRATMVHYRVTNTGVAPSDYFSYVRGPRTESIEGEIAPGATVRRSLRLDVDVLPLGKHTLQLAIEPTTCDADKVGARSNSIAYEVVPNNDPVGAGADLVVVIDSIDNRRIVQGGPWASVTWHVENRGTGVARATDGKITVSFVLDGKDWPIGGMYVKTPLAPGGRATGGTGVVALSSPMTLGRHRFQLRVNLDGNVPETRTDNNLSNVIELEVVTR